MTAINAFKANPALAFSQFSQPKKQATPGSVTPTGGDDTYSQPSLSGKASPIIGLDKIDGELASQLKRLGKNDSKTKMRALGELKSYAREHVWEDGLEGMMLAWPPLFRRHIFDPDRRVRNAVAGVHGVLVKRTGKKLAPNLKQIIGPWVAAFFDPYREVGQTARSAFESVFPESKRSEVFVYTIEDLLSFAIDNIVNQTAETLSDARFTDAEEMRLKYEQVIGASFGMLGSVVKEVSPDKVLEYKGEFDKVLDNKSSVKFVAHTSTHVRRSVYKLVRVIMLRCPGLVRDSYQTLGHALLSNCFIDGDASAHGDMWDAVLLLTKKYSQIWTAEGKVATTAGSKKKSIESKLFEFLRKRCKLSPTISYPSILALLATLPAEILDTVGFESNLLDSLWQGASGYSGDGSATADGGNTVPAVRLASQQESVALMSSVCECLAFLWTRKLRTATADNQSSSAGEAVTKEAARENNRLWHYYLQHSKASEDMSMSMVKLYSKLCALSAKYEPSLFGKIWAQVSWFALRKLSGDDIKPIVSLVALLGQQHDDCKEKLDTHVKQLLGAFCQVAIQSLDGDTARLLIQTLTQMAPATVFEGGIATKFSERLEELGAREEAISLVLARAVHAANAAADCSTEKAIADIDLFLESTLDREADGAYSVVTGVLDALPNTLASMECEQVTSYRLPLLKQALLKRLPATKATGLVRVFGQALQLHFGVKDKNNYGSKLVDTNTTDQIMKWMEQEYCTFSGDENALHEVMSVWITLARDDTAGPRFVQFWLQRPNSIIGQLFATANADSDGEMSSKMLAQARRVWSAVETQIVQLKMGSELAQNLGESIALAVFEESTKQPAILAKLAYTVYTRICPSSDASIRQDLLNKWVLDSDVWQLALAADADQQQQEPGMYLESAMATGEMGLRQAIEQYSVSRPSVGGAPSFHTLTAWAKAASIGNASTPVSYYTSRFARRAMFVSQFLLLNGTKEVVTKDVQELVLSLTLAFVLLRESLLKDNQQDIAETGVAVQKLQEVISAMVAQLITSPLEDSSHWLSVLSSIVIDGKPAVDAWGRMVAECIGRIQRSNYGLSSPWVLVLGALSEWCRWTNLYQPADVEHLVAIPLSEKLATGISCPILAVLLARGSGLSQRAQQSPAMASALLDALGSLSKNVEDAQQSKQATDLALEWLISGFELLAELLPSGQGALEAPAATSPKIVDVLCAIPDMLPETVEITTPLETAMTLAVMALLQRFAMCTLTVNSSASQKLSKLCLQSLQRNDSAVVVVGVARAASELAVALSFCAEDAAAIDLAKPNMQEIGRKLLESSILGERPESEVVHALVKLVRCGFAKVPSFAKLYPVLANATPMLNAELVRLILATSDVSGYIGDSLDDLVRMVNQAAKALSDLSVPLDTFTESVEDDEYVRAACLRLLTGLLMVSRFGDGLSAANLERHERLSELLSEQQLFDSSMVWVCALLGLSNKTSSVVNFRPQLWDPSKGLDWATFTAELALNPNNEQLFQVLALQVLYSLAWTFPSAFRSWWAGLPQSHRGTSMAIEQFVTKYISPLIVEREFSCIRLQAATEADVEERLAQLSLTFDTSDMDGVVVDDKMAVAPTPLAEIMEEYDDATVKITTGQVALTYTVDDSAIEINILLPTSYPLTIPQIESIKRVAVPEKRWRSWLVAAQGLVARNRRADSVCAQILGNVGAHFAGVEDCAICYSAVGVLDNSLPTKQCKTCKNKFHRMCLYKWFSTSNQSSCPLCRNLF